MAFTFDATLKEMGRDSPHGILAAFDQPPTLPVKLLNVDLSTVTMAADLIVGLGEPLAEIVHFEFQSSAAAWKDADLMACSALLFRYYHVPVHTVVVLLDKGAVMELDRDNKPLWRIEGVQFPLDVQALPGDRVLLAEQAANKVTERDHKGKVVW